MKLINVDTLDDYLGKWADDFYENPENSDADFMDGYCMTLNRIYSGTVPEVNAIPIEWIEQYVKSKTALLGDSELWIKWMIEDWEKEQEKTIDNLPVVDANLVRHAKWDHVTVVNWGFWRCSNCRTPSEVLGVKYLYRYCPFCGAKMDADEEDQNGSD